MSKKLRCFALVAAMLCGLSACGKSTGSSDSGKNSGAGSSAASQTETIDPETINTGKYEEPVTLTSYFRIATVFLNLFNEEELKNCYYTQQQIEQTNITIDYEWYAPDTAEDAVQKTSMAIASGEIPDFMIVDRSQLALLAKTDLINKELEPLWDAYASDTLKAWTTAEGPDAWESLRYNGKIIGLPRIRGSVDQGEMIWIRKDWLDNLNLDIPTTMDELYDVMLAFKNNDPDGNGQDDTIGMTLCKDFLSGPNTGDAIGLFNGFGAYPKIWVPSADGSSIEYGSVTEGAKDALSWMARAYADGLIEQDFSSMDSNKAAEASVSGRSGVQWGAMWNHMWPLQSTVDNNNDAEWIAVPVLPAHEGDTAHPQCDVGISQIFVISSKCEHPEAVIKLLNFWVETQLLPKEERDKYMMPDESGTMTFPQHYAMLKTENPLKNLDAYHHVCEALESGDASSLNAEETGYYDDSVAFIEGDVSKAGPYRTFGPGNSAFNAIDYYYSNDLYMFNKFTTADTPAMQQKQSTVDDKIIEFYTQVIMGIKSVDDWDTFMGEVNSLGLSDITAEANDWYKNK